MPRLKTIFGNDKVSSKITVSADYNPTTNEIDNVSIIATQPGSIGVDLSGIDEMDELADGINWYDVYKSYKSRYHD